VTAQGNEAAVGVDRRGEIGRDQHLAAERFAQSFDAGDLVNLRAGHGEIKPVDGANVADQFGNRIPPPTACPNNGSALICASELTAHRSAVKEILKIVTLPLERPRFEVRIRREETDECARDGSAKSR